MNYVRLKNTIRHFRSSTTSYLYIFNVYQFDYWEHIAAKMDDVLQKEFSKLFVPISVAFHCGEIRKAPGLS